MSGHDEWTSMSDITQSETPVVSSPTILNEEALRTVDQSDLYKRMLSEAATIAPAAEQPGARRRGRPKGSRNKATLEREAAGISKPPGGARMVAPPGGRSSSNATDDERTPEQIKEAKAKRVEELTEKIADGINDNLMLLLTSAGVPPTLLYRPGFEPRKVSSNGKFTDFAGNITVSPMQANIYARFLTEAETLPSVQKVVGNTGQGNGPLVLYGLLSVAASIQYVQGLQKFVKELKPLLEAKRAYDNVQNAKRQQEDQQQQA